MTMDTSSSLWLFFALTFGIIVLPGMDMAFITGSALARGLRGGVAALAGIVVGGLLHVLINLSGVAALLRWWPGAFQLLLLAGSAYMAWIGWGLMRSARQLGKVENMPEGAAAQAAPMPAGSLWAVFRSGILNCLLNPKAYAFMLAVFPAFLRSEVRSVGAQAFLLGAIIAGNQIAIYGTVLLLVALAHKARPPRLATQRRMMFGVGLLLILAALAGLWGGWHGLEA
ncbi:LysE family translocator [Paucibacter sp. Y2R2-4]|uniref:LysE family translocator n=1 Tax=Paucibacter sp. Y2R2-4 TaxID=2893553 RepID=UPI0021E39231|nr:LysE family translocator [Paucibacter sp. Y2R2-4]MCV2350120.1 LysE family translocator [Paucibacter sp. Y2R2-4]